MLKLLGKNGSFSNDYLHSFQVLMESCISFRAKQRGNFFHIVGSHYQQASICSYFQLLDIEGKDFAQIELAFETVVGWGLCIWQSDGFEIGTMYCLLPLHAPNYTSRPQCIFQLKFYLDMSCIHGLLLKTSRILVICKNLASF